jgi:hypothetical protein
MCTSIAIASYDLRYQAEDTDTNSCPVETRNPPSDGSAVLTSYADTNGETSKIICPKMSDRMSLG